MCGFVDFVSALSFCFEDWVVAPSVVVDVVPVVVPVVPVPVPPLHAPIESPWLPMWAGNAFLLISIVTPGFFFDPVL